MMKAIAFNGSPRKNKNTATLLNRALEGVSSKGFQTELIHLYDYNFSGCRSCFECKRIGGESYGKCKFQDEASDLIKKAYEADTIIFLVRQYILGTSLV